MILACLSVGLGFSLYSLIMSMALHPQDAGKVKVTIQATGKVGDIVTAIESLKRSDIVVITKDKTDFGISAIPGMTIAIAFFASIISGITLFFYKLYCRWLGIQQNI